MKLEDYITPWLIQGLRLYARQFARKYEDAEDIAQNALLKACRYFDRYDPKYKFTTWIYRIVQREAYNMQRDIRGVLGPATGHHPVDEAKFMHPVFIDHKIWNEKISKLEWFEIPSTHPENGYIEAIDGIS